MLGKDVSDKLLVAELGKMLRLVITGITVSGKLVGINEMTLKILCKATLKEMCFIMIKPKILKLFSMQRYTASVHRHGD